MRHHSILATLVLLIFAPHAQAMEKPFRVSLIGDGFDGTAWQTGILIELDDGWKTYWRMPGNAGIPPNFTWKTSVPADVSVSFPTPGRYRDATGETIGYKHEVVLPVTVTAGKATSVSLDLDLFFAVCKDVCIPAKATASMVLGTAVNDAAGAARVAQAMATVPQPGQMVSAASIVIESGKPVLLLALDGRLDDIFVETSTNAYFRAPQFSVDGNEGRLIIDNVADVAKLKGAMLKLTLSQGSEGLEQNLTLP